MKASRYRSFVCAFLAAGDKKKAARLLWPQIVQNEQSDLIFDRLEREPFMCVMGHASASKTFTAAQWFLLDWWSYPGKTATMVTSDTIASLSRRVWNDILQLFLSTKVDMPGVVNKTKRMIQYRENDEKHAIACLAAEARDSQSKIQGVHTERMRVLIDEADNKFSNSIWSAIANLGASGDLKVAALANPEDQTSEFAQYAEPTDGWSSINADRDLEWKSRKKYHVLRLDGARSPNVLAKKDIYPFLLTLKGVKEIEDKNGEESIEWWKYYRAMYAPTSATNTFFTQALLDRCVNQKLVWYSSIQTFGGLDVSFGLEGGDKCVLCVTHVGRVADDPSSLGIRVRKFHILKRTRFEMTVTEDIASQALRIMEDEGLDAANLAIDVGGANGQGVADYIQMKTERTPIGVNSGESASEIKILPEDRRLPVERYTNMATELWAAASQWAGVGRIEIADAPRDFVIQILARRYHNAGKGKIGIESKKKMSDPRRGLKSPDEADSFCLAIHAVRMKMSGLSPSHDRVRVEANRKSRKLRVRTTIYNQTYGT